MRLFVCLTGTCSSLMMLAIKPIRKKKLLVSLNLTNFENTKIQWLFLRSRDYILIHWYKFNQAHLIFAPNQGTLVTYLSIVSFEPTGSQRSYHRHQNFVNLELSLWNFCVFRGLWLHLVAVWKYCHYNSSHWGKTLTMQNFLKSN